MNHALLQKKPAIHATRIGVAGIAGFSIITGSVRLTLQHEDAEPHLDFHHHVDGDIFTQLWLAGQPHGLQKRIIPFIVINLLLFTTLSLLSEFIQQQISPPPIKKKTTIFVTLVGHLQHLFLPRIHHLFVGDGHRHCGENRPTTQQKRDGTKKAGNGKPKIGSCFAEIPDTAPLLFQHAQQYLCTHWQIAR